MFWEAVIICPSNIRLFLVTDALFQIVLQCLNHFCLFSIVYYCILKVEAYMVSYKLFEIEGWKISISGYIHSIVAMYVCTNKVCGRYQLLYITFICLLDLSVSTSADMEVEETFDLLLLGYT